MEISHRVVKGFQPKCSEKPNVQRQRCCPVVSKSVLSLISLFVSLSFVFGNFSVYLENDLRNSWKSNVNFRWKPCVCFETLLSYFTITIFSCQSHNFYSFFIFLFVNKSLIVNFVIRFNTAHEIIRFIKCQSNWKTERQLLTNKLKFLIYVDTYLYTYMYVRLALIGTIVG